jgi:hypothetical protein
MLNVRKLASAVVLASLLGACAGRDAAQIPVVQPQDQGLNCSAIQAETTANTARITDLGRESGNKTAQNVAAGVAGLFIWPLWFAIDFQGSTGNEEAALQSRQQYLATLAEQRSCAAPVPPPSSPPAQEVSTPSAITQAVLAARPRG